jgi:rhodanese-related sulfurtransferase
MAQSINMPRMWSFGVALGLVVGGLTIAERSRLQRSFVVPQAQLPASDLSAKPVVRELRAGTVAHLMNRRYTRVAIFDLRSAAEFAVSHLPEAVSVGSEISVEQFMAQYGAALHDRVVMFYCAAGVRSASFAAGIERELVMSGARSVHSLKDGVIGWANEGRWLRDAKGLTAAVHPGHNDPVPRLRTPTLARYEPRGAALAAR